jgi:hypothetical protein
LVWKIFFYAYFGDFSRAKTSTLAFRLRALAFAKVLKFRRRLKKKVTEK